MIQLLAAALQIAAAATPDFETNHAAGEALLKQGKLTAAIPLLERARKADPAHYVNSWDLAAAYLESGRLAEARSLAGAMLARQDKPELRNLLARIEDRAGNATKAAELYQEAAHAEPSEKHIADWANHLLRYRAYASALQVYAKAVEMHPRSSPLRVGLGVAHYSAGNYDDAVRVLCEAVDLNPADPRPLTFLGKMIDVSPQLNNEIARRMDGYVARFPGNALAHLYLAKAGGSEAERHFRQAAALDPKLAAAPFELGLLCEKRGRDKDAVAAYERAASIDNSLETAYYRLTRLYRKLGQAERARLAMEQYRRAHAAASAKPTSTAPALVVQ